MPLFACHCHPSFICSNRPPTPAAYAADSPLTCTLPRCLAHLCRYNPRVPLASQLNISGPLLSRFDVVILLLDQVGSIA